MSKTETTQAGDVEIRETRYGSGLREIVFRTPSLIAGQLSIVRSIVTKHHDVRHWFVHHTGGPSRALKLRNRETAFAEAIAFAHPRWFASRWSRVPLASTLASHMQGRIFIEPVTRYDVAMDDTPANHYRLEEIAYRYGQKANQDAIYVQYASGDVELVDTARVTV